MSPAAKSQAQIILKVDVYGFTGIFSSCFFLSQLEERHLIIFSLKSALHAGQVGKEKAVKIELSVPLCGSWLHSPLLLHYGWITKSLVMFFCPSPFSHTEIRLHTARNMPGGDGGTRDKQTKNAF